MLPVMVANLILKRVLKYTRDLLLDWEVTVPLGVAKGKLLEVKLLGGDGG